MVEMILALLAGAGWMGWYAERLRRINAERMAGTHFSAVVPKPRDPEPPAEERALAAAKKDAHDEVVERLMMDGISEKEARRMLRYADGNVG